MSNESCRNSMNNCNHKIQGWRTVTYDTWDGEITERVSESRSAFEDIDLHRCRCTKCGKIEYYSSAAHNYYVNGIKSPNIKGLDR